MNKYLFIVICSFHFFFAESKERMTLGESADCEVILSGISGNFGYSKLHLANSILTPYFTSEYFNFHYDAFASVGAVIQIHPKIFPQRINLRLDPSFVKYSYGSHDWQNSDEISCSIDIDAEYIRLPISLQIDLLKNVQVVKPFLRVGYSFGYLITYDALFQYKTIVSGEVEEITYEYFNFSRYQNFLLLTTGVDFKILKCHLLLEGGFELGDGIYHEKYGNAFLKKSRTINFQSQISLLF